MPTEVNPTSVNAIIKELEGQRNNAHSRCAHLAAENAALSVALEASQKRVAELEKEKADTEAKNTNEAERDAA
jgi:hypothetical protein